MNKKDEGIAVEVGEAMQYNLRPIAFGGHCYYVRKGVVGDRVENAEAHVRQLNGIVLPETYSSWCQWVEILAKGPMVGKPCSKKHMKKFERARCINTQDVPIGALALCPNKNPGIKISPVNREVEAFIEESVPFLYYIED